METQKILNEALLLNPEERIHLIKMLTQSLINTDKNMEQLWMEESEKRFALLKAGKIKTISFEEISKQYK